MKMLADGALEQKLDAWVKANKDWAAAAGQHQLVPTYYFGGGQSGGNNSSASDFINMMMVSQAKSLSLDMSMPQ